MRLNEVCDQKQSTLSEKKVALDQLSRLTDHCIQFVSYSLENGSDMDLLYSKKYVFQFLFLFFFFKFRLRRVLRLTEFIHYFFRSVTNHLERIKKRRADIPNPEIPVRIHLSADKLPDLIKGHFQFYSTSS